MAGTATRTMAVRTVVTVMAVMTVMAARGTPRVVFLILLSHFIRRLAVRASKVHTHGVASNLRVVNVANSILSSLTTIILDESKSTLLMSVIITWNVNICDRTILFEHIL